MVRLGLIFVSVASFVLLARSTEAEVLIGLARPMTGPYAGSEDWVHEGAQAAIAELNAQGGVLGQSVEIVRADDYCDGEQAVVAAAKLIADGVVAAFGHPCSGAAIPASKVYADADILMISDGATNPTLTEQDFTNVFRVAGRDDLQGQMAGDLLAERWGDKPIAILHDGQTYGEGLATEVKRRLNQRGVAEAMFEAIEPGEAEYGGVVQEMRARGIEVLYFGGYPREAGLIIREARDRGYALQLVSGDGIGGDEFALIAGPGSDGTLITNPPVPDPEANPEVAALQREYFGRPPLPIYGALQAWAQAVEKAGTFETEAVAKTLRTDTFDTVLGTIGFDAKGDITGTDPFVWYIWNGGKAVPLAPGSITQ